MLTVVWQQEEWIKANTTKDTDGEANPDAMQGLEMAQK